MTGIGILFIFLLVAVVLFGLFYPKTYGIYKSKDKALVLVTGVNKTVVTIQYVEYNEKLEKCTAITGPQNWDLWEFIKTFRLWKIM